MNLKRFQILTATPIPQRQQYALTADYHLHHDDELSSAESKLRVNKDEYPKARIIDLLILNNESKFAFDNNIITKIFSKNYNFIRNNNIYMIPLVALNELRNGKYEFSKKRCKKILRLMNKSIIQIGCSMDDLIFKEIDGIEIDLNKYKKIKHILKLSLKEYEYRKNYFEKYLHSDIHEMDIIAKEYIQINHSKIEINNFIEKIESIFNNNNALELINASKWIMEILIPNSDQKNSHIDSIIKSPCNYPIFVTFCLIIQINRMSALLHNHRNLFKDPKLKSLFKFHKNNDNDAKIYASSFNCHYLVSDDQRNISFNEIRRILSTVEIKLPKVIGYDEFLLTIKE